MTMVTLIKNSLNSWSNFGEKKGSATPQHKRYQKGKIKIQKTFKERILMDPHGYSQKSIAIIRE